MEFFLLVISVPLVEVYNLFLTFSEEKKKVVNKTKIIGECFIRKYQLRLAAYKFHLLFNVLCAIWGKSWPNG